MENKYQRGKIYKIISPHTYDCIYIGSTTEKTLACRMRKHRAAYRCWKAGKYHYMSSFDMIEAGDESIILIEAYPCNSKDELRAREQHHIELNAGLCINEQRALRTLEEKRRYEEDYQKEHRHEKHNCVCGGKFTTINKAQHIGSKKHQKYLTGAA
jgi:hypothetical protein